MLIAGDADNGGGGIANGFTTPYQKLRAGLGLLTDAGGNKAVIVSFSINGENPRGPGHGFVVAYDVRGLNREAGFTPTPAIWNVTPGGGAGGVWMSGSGPAIDGNDIYLATGNGMDPGTMPGNFGESFVKLRYTAGAAGVNNGKPKLAVADFWGAFSDFGRQDEDQDLGAAGVFIIPERGNLVGGGKDGILYNLNKDNLGKNTWDPQFNLPFVATYLPNPPNGAAGLPTTTPPIRTGRSSISIATCRCRRRRARRITSTARPCTWRARRAGSSTCGARTSGSRRTTTISRRSASPRFALKGRSSRPATWTARRHAGRTPRGLFQRHDPEHRRGLGRVSDARECEFQRRARRARRLRRDERVIGGKLRQLFHSDDEAANDMGNFAKYSTPVVANGKVYVGTFSNKVVQYGL